MLDKDIEFYIYCSRLRVIDVSNLYEFYVVEVKLVDVFSINNVRKLIVFNIFI